MQYCIDMSGGHLRTVQRACTAWCEGDISVYREMYLPDVVAAGGRLWPEGEGSVAGVAAVMRNFESLMAAFERSELIPESYLEAGDTLVVRLLWRGQLRGSEAPVEQRLVCSYRFKDGLIAYTAWFEHLGDALRAVGLPETAESELTPVQAEPPVASGARAEQPGH